MVEIEKIQMKDIVPAEYNPRIISDDEMDKLKSSLEEFGLVDPIVVNLKNNHIIGGHQRFEILQQNEDNKYDELNLIRLGDIGWVFADADLKIESDDHEKALNLRLNNLSGDWDYDKLTSVFEDLQLSGINVELTGFDDTEIEVMLDDFEYNEIFDEIDSGIEEPEEELEEIQDNQKDHNIVYISFIDWEKANKFLEIIDHNTFFREDGFKKIVVDGDELVERLSNEE